MYLWRVVTNWITCSTGSFLSTGSTWILKRLRKAEFILYCNLLFLQCLNCVNHPIAKIMKETHPYRKVLCVLHIVSLAGLWRTTKFYCQGHRVNLFHCYTYIVTLPTLAQTADINRTFCDICGPFLLRLFFKSIVANVGKNIIFFHILGALPHGIVYQLFVSSVQNGVQYAKK